MALAAGCPPAGPGPAGPTGVVETAGGGPGPTEPEPEPAAPDGTSAGRPVELTPCMPAADVLAWARGRGADVVAAALARHLTDRTPADIPEVPADRVAGWIRALDAAPLADPDCASLIVTLWFDPRTFLTERAGADDARAVAIFSPALTEPAVAYALCADGRETCRILRLEDLDGDRRTDLLVERARRDVERPPSQALYVFPDDSDPLPVWISDDDAVRRALFGAAGETDPDHQATLADVSFDSLDGGSAIRAAYRLLVCDDRAVPPAERCASTGERTLVFTRLGDVYLLPDEPEPGAPWGRPPDDGATSLDEPPGDGPRAAP